MERDLILKEGKVYVLKDEELRVEIIQLYHDILVVEHGGRWKIIELVTRNYWLPRVIRDMGKYIDGCNICQRMKYRTETPEKLKLRKVLKKLWTHLTVDFITKLLLVVKKNAILVICDRLSKMMYFVAITKRPLVEGLVRLFRDNMWKLHRLLEIVVSDRRLQFIAKMMEELNKILEIETKLSTLFHLQTDSQIVRMNQELEQYLYVMTLAWLRLQLRQRLK